MLLEKIYIKITTHNKINLIRSRGSVSSENVTYVSVNTKYILCNCKDRFRAIGILKALFPICPLHIKNIYIFR